MDDMQHQRRAGIPGGWILALVGIVAVAAIVWGITRFGDDAPQAESRISQVLENPREFFGQNITVTGEVETVIGSRAITIDAPRPFSSELLVISKQPLEPIGGSGINDYLFREDDRVSAQGTVREFNIREIERELGVDLIDSEFVEWEGRPVVIAETVEQER